MSLDADLIVDRRRMRRKLTFWRVVTVLIAIVAVVGAGLAFSNRGAITGGPGGSIARINIEGVIRGSRPRVEALDRLAKSNAKAVIVHINSPGGTVAGSEELYDSLIKLKAKKPMVVVVDGLAASGGYIAAMASDRILAQQSAIVGSIGVIFQYPNVTELLKTIGVQVETIKSSPLNDWFRTLVRDRRHLEPDLLQKVADGRVFTGRQAVELKLIDALGDEEAAVDWLAKEKGVDAKTPVRDYPLSPRFSDLPFLHVAALGLLDAVGLNGFAERFREFGAIQAVERLNLDGLLALWHPPSTN
jgi:protease-4